MKTILSVIKCGLLLGGLFLLGFQPASAYKLNGIKWSGGAYNYYINPIGVNNGVDYSSKSQTIINGAALWTGVATSNVGINYLGTTTNQAWGANDGLNVITWVTNGWTGSVIGTSTYWYSGSNIIDSDIKLNTNFHNDSRLPTLVTHEVGHSIGIGHTRESGDSYTTDEYQAIMYWLLHGQSQLNSHDKCAVTGVYPASPTCSPGSAAGIYQPQPCCSGEGGVNVSVTVSNKVHTYSGTAKFASVSVSPSGISYTVTYRNHLGAIVSNPINAGVYEIEVTITQPEYADQGPFYDNLVINKRGLQVYANNITVNYGEPEPTFTISYSGFASGENSSVIDVLPNAWVNQTWPQAPNSYTIFVGNGSDNNYNLSYNNGTYTVNGLDVNSVTFSDNVTTYSGFSNQPTIITNPAGIDYSVSYYLNSQLVFNTTNAGQYSVVVTITEPGYNPTTHNGTLSVQKALLTVQTTDYEVFYKQQQPDYELSFVGFVNNENTNALQTMPTASVQGNWPLLPGSYPIVISGGNAINYQFSYLQSTITIIEASVNSVVFNPATRIYNGLFQPVSATISPASVSYIISYTDMANNTVDTPVDAGNYLAKLQINEPGYLAQSFEHPFTIQKKNLLAKAKDQVMEYSSTEPLYTIEYVGFENLETVSVLDSIPTVTVSGVRPLLPGTYPIVAKGGYDNNYEIVLQNGTLTVETYGHVFISIENTENTYTGLPHTAIVNTIPQGINCVIKYYNEQGVEIPKPISTGNYQVKITINDPGYDPVETFAAFKIRKAPLTIAPANTIIPYGEPFQTHISFTFDGFVNNENETALSSNPQLDNNLPSELLPGYYILTAKGAAANNYEISYNTATLTIEPLQVETFEANWQPAKYSGLPHPLIVALSPQNVSYELTYKDQTGQIVENPTNAGTYHYTVIVNETGYVSDTIVGSFTIAKTQLIVTASPISLKYGDPFPEFTYHYEGFIGNDTVINIDQVPVITANEWPLNTGEYEFTPLNGNDKNYEIVALPTKLTIEKATLQVMGNSYQIDYAHEEPLFQYSFTGFRYADDESVITALPLAQVLGQRPLKPGQYNIGLNNAEAKNYSFEYFPGTLSVKPIGNVAVESGTLETVYNGQAHYLNFRVQPQGIQHKVNYYLNNEQTEPINAGKYRVVFTVTEPGYESMDTEYFVNIAKAELKVTAPIISILTNNEIPDLVLSYEGFAGTETTDVLEIKPLAYIDNFSSEKPEIFEIKITEGTDNNYSFVYQNGKAEVIQAYTLEILAMENGLIGKNNDENHQSNFFEKIAINQSSAYYYAFANEGFRFVGWDNGDTINPLIINNIQSNLKVAALFEVKTGKSSLGNNQNVNIQVYPNPVQNNNAIHVVISGFNPKTPCSIMVFDQTGRKKGEYAYDSEPITLIGVATGVYTLAIKQANQIIGYKKLIVK